LNKKTSSISIIPVNDLNKIQLQNSNDIFAVDNFENNQQKMDYENEYSKMFNNSFDYDKDYMFHEE